MIQAVIRGKDAEGERNHEDQRNGLKYKYERVDSDDNNSTNSTYLTNLTHFENVVDESDPDLESDIAGDTYYQSNHSNPEVHLRTSQKSRRGRVITMAFGIVGVMLFLYWAVM